ncbi:MAG: DUF3097 family protein [Streptosporangiales bacterium]|nr:DUF3097 family protein [Streptosporangiales bacterium]
MRHSKDYGTDVLAGDWRRAAKRQVPEVPAEPGLVVEEVGDGFCGAVVDWSKDAMVLEDRHGKRRNFPWGHGYLVDGAPVAITRPAAAAPKQPARSASGSIAVTDHRARIARASRILVEGVHDGELVERVWGHDLRVAGVVVEPLHGIDDLAEAIADVQPGPHRRIGVLLDHLVTGSKESRIAAAVTSPHVLVVGHPFVDIWQAVRPRVLGIPQWPEIPRGTDWKTGICHAFGWPAEDAADIGQAWQRILDKVQTYVDLEPALLAVVEELIDFVTVGPDETGE